MHVERLLPTPEASALLEMVGEVADREIRPHVHAAEAEHRDVVRVLQADEGQLAVVGDGYLDRAHSVRRVQRAEHRVRAALLGRGHVDHHRPAIRRDQQVPAAGGQCLVQQRPAHGHRSHPGERQPAPSPVYLHAGRGQGHEDIAAVRGDRDAERIARVRDGLVGLGRGAVGRVPGVSR